MHKCKTTRVLNRFIILKILGSYSDNGVDRLEDESNRGEGQNIEAEGYKRQKDSKSQALQVKRYKPEWVICKCDSTPKAVIRYERMRQKQKKRHLHQ